MVSGAEAGAERPAEAIPGREPIKTSESDIGRQSKAHVVPRAPVFDWLSNEGVEFRHNAYFRPYWVDFLVGEVAIEVDGVRWHDPEKDALRDARIREYGVEVRRISARRILQEGPTVVCELLPGCSSVE